MYEICAKSIFWKENLCALQVFLCALISQPLCTHTRARLRGNIALLSPPNFLNSHFLSVFNFPSLWVHMGIHIHSLAHASHTYTSNILKQLGIRQKSFIQHFTSEKYIKNVQNYLLAMRVCPKFYVKKWATEHTSSFWGLQRKHCLQYENRVSKEVGKSYVLYSTLVSSPGWISFLLDALHFAHPNLECLSQSGDEYPTEKLK